MLELNTLKTRLNEILNNDVRSSNIDFVSYLPDGSELDKFLVEVVDAFNKIISKTHCFITFNEISYALFPCISDEIIEIIDYDLNVLTSEETQNLNPSFEEYILVSILLSYGGNFELYPVTNSLERLKILFEESGIPYTESSDLEKIKVS